jgi:hypothetical protein
MSAENEIHLYWATGCTSCLRVKEYLERNDVPFHSRNVVKADGDGGSTGRSKVGIRGPNESVIEEMTELGLPDHVPIVRQGEDWADGKDLEAVSELVGIEHEADLLPVEELRDSLYVMLDATQRFLELLPKSELETEIPNRPRSYADVIQHIFSLPDVFIMHEAGVPMDGVPRIEHDWDPYSKTALSTYGSSVQGRLADWFEGPGQSCDWSETADVFWGTPTKHEFLERTTWHTGQHTRQVQWILTEELEIEVEEPLDPELWEGLPMPEKVWDTE